MLRRLIGFLVICGSLAVGWLMMEIRSFTETPLDLPEQGVLYSLEPGSSVGKVARDLQGDGFITSAFYFQLLARWQGQTSQIKAGEYRIERGATPVDLLEQFVSGRVTRYDLTLVEGWDFRQMLAVVLANKALKPTLEGLTQEEIMHRLGHQGEHPEGRFLADTYYFPRGTTDQELLARAYAAMQQFLQKEWEGRASELPLKNRYEALILASIVEKETGLASERPEIAGVFMRRLRKRMKLQTDPTVIYGMGDRYKGNIRRRDLKDDNPYNTYVHRGLPPTPISMPGHDAIRAVLHPADGDTLYFVSQGDGSHVFSASLREHNQAVRKHQLKR